MKMTAITRYDLKSLAMPHAWPCISLYTSIKREGYEAAAFLQQLQNTAQSLTSHLIAKGFTSSQSEALLKPIVAFDKLGLEALYRDYAGRRLGGLAFLISPDFVRGYVSGEKLPELSAIRPHFELRPLIDATSMFDAFHVLAASPSEVKLWRIDLMNAHTVDLPKDVPESQRVFLENTEFAPKLAYHATGSGAPGTVVGKWYGTVERDRQDKMLDDYALAIARPITHVLASSQLPLVLAASENLAVMLRKHLSKVPLLIDEDIHASPSHLSLPELASLGWQRVRKLEEQRTASELTRFKEHFATPRTASTRDDIWSSAIRGQIDILLTAKVRNITLDDERSELVSACIQETLHRAGKVLLTDDPFLMEACPMGAILRW